MRSDYEEKKAARIEGYEKAAEKAAKESDRVFESSKRIADQIPFGQPILVGHHSEKKTRRVYEKIQNDMRKSVDLHNKSKYYEQKAESAENNTSISSDNPEAISELEFKLDSLTKKQELMKLANKTIKKWVITGGNLSEMLESVGIRNAIAIEISKPDCMGRWGFPRYALTNNNAMIRSTKKRIDELKRRFAQKSEERIIGDVRIMKNIDENRVQIFFPGKPEPEIRTELKRNGFRWAPSVGAWQAYVTGYKFEKAIEILEE